MKKYTLAFFFFLFLHQTFAQDLTQDSLALVSFYNSTNGASWRSKTNWLTGSVGTWQGVSVSGGRVQTLSLANNSLTGSIPPDFCELTGLQYIYLQNNSIGGGLLTCIGNMSSIISINVSNNHLNGDFPAGFATNMPNLTDIWISNNSFTTFPDLSSVSTLSILHIDNNNLEFADVIPNINIPGLDYLYSGQVTSKGSGADLYVYQGESFALQISIRGAGNVYQWQNSLNTIDTTRISGASSDSLVDHNAQTVDDGNYNCIITNSAAPLLTISSQSRRVQVVSRIQPTITFNNADSMHCGDTLQLSATHSGGLPVSFHLLGDSTNLPVRFLPATNTNYTIIAYNDGDSSYLPATDTLVLRVLTYASIPSFSIANNLPLYAGEELELSVLLVPAVNYVWDIPLSGLVYGSAITIPEVADSNQGIYKVTMTEGSCFLDSLSIDVELTLERDIVIYELITPNGDGDNETFYIANINDLPSVEVEVYNVWNQTVYHSDHYNNDWTGDNLPVGTYYYLVNVKAWNKSYKGNLYIKR